MLSVRRERVEGRVTTTNVCIVCGQQFGAKRQWGRYCDREACRKEANLGRSRAYRERAKAAGKLDLPESRSPPDP